jgi:branched-chain amino acid transport system permease protein
MSSPSRAAPSPGPPPSRAGSGIAAGAGLAAALVSFGLTSRDLGLLSTVTTVFMYGTLAQAWNILGGYGGYLNFGMAGFFGVGAYTAAILHRESGVSPLAAAPVAGCVAVLVALLVGVPSLRLRGAYFALATLIITFALQVVALDVPLTQGSLGIYLAPLRLSPRQSEQVFYFTYLGLLLAATVLVYWVERSALGYALVAVREDEDAAEVLGVPTLAVKVTGLLLGAFLAGVVGGVYAGRILYIEPTGTFAIDLSLNIVLMTVVGGSGTWQGPLVGAPLVLLVAEALRVGVAHTALFGAGVPPELNRAVFGVVLIVVALLAPQGLVGIVRGIQGRSPPG